MDERKSFKCYYCSCKESELEEIIEHCITNHKHSVLKYRHLIIEETSGLLKYQTKTHEGIIPGILELEGKSIKVRDNQTYIHRATPKRKKLNTPVKVGKEETQLEFEEETDSSTHFDTSTDVIEVERAYNELVDILPSVLKNLETQGNLESYLKYNRLLLEDKLPVKNICHLLFLDLVEWFSCGNTSMMRYRSETMKFWQIGYRLFHGKFIRFMSGPRHAGQLLNEQTEKGHYDPLNSHINFPVPSRQNLYGKEKMKPILPGICVDSIKAIAEVSGEQPMKLAIDAKKISRGKGKLMGDVDCWGFENKPCLKERKQIHADYIDIVQSLNTKIKAMEEKGISSLTCVPLSLKPDLVDRIKETIQVIALRNKSLRELNVSLSNSEKKFMELGGDKWRESRFYPVICSIRIQKGEVKKQIRDGLTLADELGFHGANINGKQTLFSKSTTVIMDEQENYNALCEDNSSNETRFIPQRTKQWFEIRKEARITGSSCNTALGLGKLKQQQAHFDKVNSRSETLSETEPEPELSHRLQYGTRHEIDSIATITGKILPLYFPDLEFYEEGCEKIPYKDNASFMVVSPDGSLRSSYKDPPVLMFENKCKAPDSYNPASYYCIPKYYTVQLLSEMNAYHCSELLFSCWSEQSTTVFHVRNDPCLWTKCWDELTRIYGNNTNKRPSRFSEVAKELKDDVKTFTEDHVTLLGEFTSCKAVPLNQQMSEVNGPYRKGKCCRRFDETNISDLMVCLQGAQKWLEEVYELLRTVASEILVFMANNLDRAYQWELNNAHPIAYALKGPSMSTDVFRQMTDEVIRVCEENGVRIVATGSDGQWHQYGVRDHTKFPLTMHQLHRDHWSSVNSREKAKLLSELKSINVVHSIEDVQYEKNATTIIVHGQKLNDPVCKLSAKEKKADVFLELTSDIAKIGGNQIDVHENSYSCYEGCFEGSFEEHVDEDTLDQIDAVASEVMSLSSSVLGNDFCTNQQFLPCDFGHYLFSEEATEADQHIRAPSETKSIASVVAEAHKVLYSDDIDMTTSYTNDAHCGDRLENMTVSCSFNEDDHDTSTAQSFQFSQSIEHFEIVATACVDQGLSQNENQVILTESTETVSPANSVLVGMMNALCRDQASMKKHNWSLNNIGEFGVIFTSKERMSTVFLKRELFICAEQIEAQLLQPCKKLNLNWTKQVLLDYVYHAVNYGTVPDQYLVAHKTKRQPKSLRKLAHASVSKLPKSYIAAKFAERIWDDTCSSWYSKCPVPSGITVEGVEDKIDWFTQPSTGGDGKIRFHFTDACHLLTCLRTKICTTGISGLKTEAWEMAALSQSTKLNISVVVDCIDKQDVALARRMFAQDVEDCIRRNGKYSEEAEFCGLIRNWFDAEDEPSIPAVERTRHRMKLRRWLLSGYRIGKFPPPTRYVRGIPIVTFEGLVSHIERKIQLHAVVPRYNVRATGSQEVEQFFSTFRDMDPSGKGTPKPDVIPDMMAAAIEIDNFRLDPDKPFFIKTSRAEVYPSFTMSGIDAEHEAEILSRNPQEICHIDCIFTRDHLFDLPQRTHRKPRRKQGCISKPGKPAHGEMGVRQFHARDDSKILAHRRLGFKELPE